MALRRSGRTPNGARPNHVVTGSGLGNLKPASRTRACELPLSAQIKFAGSCLDEPMDIGRRLRRVVVMVVVMGKAKDGGNDHDDCKHDRSRRSDVNAME